MNYLVGNVHFVFHKHSIGNYPTTLHT